MRRGTIAVRATLGAALALSCLPTIPPDWLVDGPIVLGIQPVVVAVGPLTSPLTEDPPGVTRADALPGDLVRLSALVVNGDGPLDLEASAAIWLRCADGCGYSTFIASGDPAQIIPCDEAESNYAPLCRIGVGAAALRRIPKGFGDSEDYLLVTGTPGGRSSEACLGELLAAAQDRGEALFDCLYVERRINLGPARTLAEINSDGDFDPTIFAETDPNYNPGIERLSLRITGPGGTRSVDVADGDRVDVAVGERVVVEVVPVAGAEQEFAINGPAGAVATEVLEASWFLTAHLADVDGESEPLTHAFRVPVGVGDFDEYVVVRDGRASLSWARLRWRVIDAEGGG